MCAPSFRSSTHPPSTGHSSLLVEEGLLLRTDLGAGRAYYEPARDHPHHHLVCEICGEVTHVHGESLGDLAGRIEQGAGFVLGKREITFFGTCASCRLRPKSRL